MGHEVHPIGFRTGVIYDWQAKWYAGRNYTALLREDLQIRALIKKMLGDASVAKVEIERNLNQAAVTIHTAKPGIVIGKQGAKVEELRNRLEKLTGRRVRVNIHEIRIPELDAALVARSIADQLERRVAFRRAMKQTVLRTMSRGAKGIKVIVGGRLGGAEMSRRETEKAGRVPLATLRAEIDFGIAEAETTFGQIGVKVWIYKGEVARAERPVAKAEAEGEETKDATPDVAAPAAAGPAAAPEAAIPEPAVEPAPASAEATTTGATE
jgi:small subunit ribosomal protein S3